MFHAVQDSKVPFIFTISEQDIKHGTHGTHSTPTNPITMTMLSMIMILIII